MIFRKTLIFIISILFFTGVTEAIAPFFNVGNFFGGGGGSSSSSSSSEEEESGDKGIYKIIRKHLEEDEYWKTVPTLDTRDDKKQRYDKEFSDDAKKAIFYCFSMREEEEEDAGEEKFKGYKEEEIEDIWKGSKTTSGKDDGFTVSFNTRYADKALKCIRKKEKFFHLQLWMETMGGLITQTGNDDDPEKEKRRKDDEWVIEEEERKKKNFDIFTLWRKKLGEGVLQTLHNTDEEEEKKGEKNAYVEDFSYFTYEDEGQGEMSHETPDGTFKEGRPEFKKEDAPKNQVTKTSNFADYMELNGVIGLISDSGVFMQIVNQSPGRGRKVTNKKFDAQETATGGTEGAGAVGEHFQKQRLWSRTPGRNPGYSLFYVEKKDNAEEGESPYTPFEYVGDFFDEFNNRLDEFLNKTYCKDVIPKGLQGKGITQNAQLQLIQRCQTLKDGVWERLFEIEKFATKFNDQFLEAKLLYLASTRETENVWSFNLWINLVDEALDELLKQQDDDPSPEEEESEDPEELKCDEYPEFEKIIKRADENKQDLEKILGELQGMGFSSSGGGEAQTNAFELLEEDRVKIYMDKLVEEFFPESFQEKYNDYWDKTKTLDQTLFKIRASKRNNSDQPLTESQLEKIDELRNRAGAIMEGHYNIWIDLLPSVILDEYLVPYFNAKSVIEYGPYLQAFIEENKTKVEETEGDGDPDKDTEYVRNLTLELDWHKMRACRDQDDHGDIAEKKEENSELPSEEEPDFEINLMNGEIREVDFTVCREKRIPPFAAIKFDRNDRCSKFLTEKQLEVKFKEKAKNRESWNIWTFKLDRYKREESKTFNISDAFEDETQKLAARDRKRNHEMYMACMADYNIVNAQLERSIWKEWFGDENWDGKDPGIQYECITENEVVGTKWSVKKLNEILRSMKKICKDEHNIALPCPDRIEEIQ